MFYCCFVLYFFALIAYGISLVFLFCNIHTQTFDTCCLNLLQLIFDNAETVDTIIVSK